jgi:hypothetical protein
MVAMRVTTVICIRRHGSGIAQLIRRRVLFFFFFWGGPFRHNIAENDPEDLKMVQKDASSNSTQSVIRIGP